MSSLIAREIEINMVKYSSILYLTLHGHVLQDAIHNKIFLRVYDSQQK